MFNIELPQRISSGFLQLYRRDERAEHVELDRSLRAEHASIAPKYFYDQLGSKLFEAICELEEYYPTRTEASILERHLVEITRMIGRGATLIDLGAGNCAKAAKLMPALQPRQYVPIDISVDFLRSTVGQLQSRFANISMLGLGMDFSRSMDLPDEVNEDKRVFFYPGSSIGNFTPNEAHEFLTRLHEACRVRGRVEGGLLIGVDLVKSGAVLNAAYDDTLGVTAAFNLNVLRHINHLIDSNFNGKDWRHRAFFDAGQSRVEMHLEARRDVQVEWNGQIRDFARGERIHTENSYKYTREEFLELLDRSGFAPVRDWCDPKSWFMVCYAKAQ